jgi:hypothetical protein
MGFTNTSRIRVVVNPAHAQIGREYFAVRIKRIRQNGHVSRFI